MKRKQYQRSVENRLCTRCKRILEVGERTQCNDCCKMRNNRVNALRHQRLSEGLCRCGSQRDSNKRYCDVCLARQRAKNKAIKAETIQQYGGVCSCCGEAELAFLTIDHIENDGSKHRKQIKASNGGTPFYLWLKRENFPSGFQVLCANCNLGKQIMGVCPHKSNEN